jgi:NADH:ubiquinone oxidoreductase subunit 6 (subunit J)
VEPQAIIVYAITLSAFLTVMSTNLMYSVSFLLLFFVESALFLVYLGVDYFPVVIASVYLGAIAVLFLFVIMMLKIKTRDTDYKLLPYFLAFLSSSIILELKCLTEQLEFYDLADTFFFYSEDSESDYLNWFELINSVTPTRSLGLLLYTQFFFYVLLFGVIFLVTMLGSILLAMNWFSGGQKQTYFTQASKSLTIDS